MPWLFLVSIFPSGNRSVWCKAVILRHCSPVWRIVFLFLKNIITSYNVYALSPRRVMVSETRNLFYRGNIPMKLLTMSLSMVSIGKINPCCLFCEKLVEWLAGPFTWLIFQKKVHERRANCFIFLPFFSSRARVPN